MRPIVLLKGSRLPAWICALIVMVALAAPAAAQQLADEALIEVLRRGGYNIYFRHAETDWSDGDQVEFAGDWTSCDTAKMRQLSDMGRATARRLGNAIRALGIPVGKVLSSEYCRAVETAQLMRLGPVETTRDIMNMRAADLVGGREAVIRRARRVLSQRPPTGANVVIVGHGNLMRAATDAYPQEGGSGIYAPSPQGDRGFELVSRLSSEDWSRLANEFAMPK